MNFWGGRNNFKEVGFEGSEGRLTRSLYSSFAVLYFAKLFCIAFVLFHHRAHFVFLVAPLAHCPWPESRRLSPVTSHRVNCSCVVSAEGKCISCSGQPLCNPPSARRSFLLNSAQLSQQVLSRAKLLCIRLSSTGHKSAANNQINKNGANTPPIYHTGYPPAPVSRDRIS
jgi:hypothetical protein